MTRPKRTCTEPGCPVLVTKGYCLRHNRNRRLREGQSARAPAQRETMRKYDRRWKKMREIVLGRDPICQMCEAAASTEVDHIIPRRPDQHAADVTEEELQGLCKPCHSTKTCAERDDYGTDLTRHPNPIVAIGAQLLKGETKESIVRKQRKKKAPKSKRRRKLPKDDA